jgi:hypothetical protein
MQLEIFTFSISSNAKFRCCPYVNPGAGELGVLTLIPVFIQLQLFKITNGDLVLDAKGNPNAKWYFQAPSS